MPFERDLTAGREAYRQRVWADAHAALARADATTPLGAADLEAWATSAYLLGRVEEFAALSDRAHQRYLDDGDVDRAAYCACWLGLGLAGRGDVAQASGWFARARRLLEGVEGDTVVRGYLLLAEAQGRMAGGDDEAAYAPAARAVAIAGAFHDDDLTALALHLMGRVRLRQARVAEGLELLDEAMVAVASGALSPQVPGIVYCSVIDACRAIWSLRRAHEWTQALSRWCERQPDMIAFSGECRVNRAEMMVLRGAWPEAADEARRVGERTQGGSPKTLAAALYQLGEIHRLSGEFEAAEEAYRDASRAGRQPQPGLALLRLALGEVAVAAGAARRLLAETSDPLKRARLLPAQVEIALAAGADDEARAAASELAATAATFGTQALRTMADHAAGAVALAGGDVAAASAALRRAWQGWRDLDAPYEAARVRMLLGRACRAAGDDEAAELEFAAARAVFTELGARPDLARLDDLDRGAAAAAEHRLTPREREVLQRLSAGATNREIAAELGISDRTVDRHVSNIFDKLGVGSRAAATAYALRHRLV